jgi:methylated-DNA-[protein]-cysteine S-methyltransferase
MAEETGDLLRRHQLRVTPQRRAILAAFSGGTAEHLSAEEVHARALRAVPELGRGTVYATLAELNELGVLGAVGASEPVRYETNVEPHDHFQCRLCMRLFDVEIDHPSTARLKREGFLVERVTVVASGICAECRNYEKGLEDGAKQVLERRLLDDDSLGALACAKLESPLGPLALAASELGIVRIAFEEHADHAPILARAATRRGSRAARDRLTQIATAVDSFFAGSERQSDDQYDHDGRSTTDDDVLEATRTVPYGGTFSYERFDVDLDAYQRGFAFGTNPMPIIFPCHRVTRGSEQPGAYVGGSERRSSMIAFEHARLAAH